MRLFSCSVFFLFSFCVFAEERPPFISSYQVGKQENFRVILNPELLFLQAGQEDLRYALIDQEKWISMQGAKYAPSLRFTLGFQTIYDDNDLIFSYIRCHTKKTQNTKSFSGDLFSVYWFSDLTLPLYSLASTWRLKLDAVDAYIKKRLSIGDACLLGWGLGFRAGVLNQSLKMERVGSSPLFGQSTTQSMSWYIGPKIAGFCRFLFPYSFYFSSESALHFLWTKYRLSYREKEGSFSKARLENLDRIQSPFELTFSLGWQRLFSIEVHGDFAFKAAFFLFPQENQLAYIPSCSAKRGDLYLIGFGASSRFDF